MDRKNKLMFRTNETLRVASGKESLVVVALCQCQN